MWLCASGPACQTCKRRCNASRMLLLLSWSSTVIGRAWKIYNDVPLTNNLFLDIPSTEKPCNCLGRNSKVMSVCLPMHAILQGGLQTKAQHNKPQPSPVPTLHSLRRGQQMHGTSICPGTASAGCRKLGKRAAKRSKWVAKAPQRWDFRRGSRKRSWRVKLFKQYKRKVKQN